MQNDDLLSNQTDCSVTVPSHLVSTRCLFWFWFLNNAPKICAEDHNDHNFKIKSEVGLLLVF